jgi:hypothetical protein
MPIPPVYDDGQLRIVEKQDALGSRLIVTVSPEVGAVLYEHDVAELRDALNARLERVGR